MPNYKISTLLLEIQTASQYFIIKIQVKQMNTTQIEAEYDHLKDYSQCYLEELGYNSTSLQSIDAIFKRFVQDLTILRMAERPDFKTKLQQELNSKIFCFVANTIKNAQDLSDKVERTHRQIERSIKCMNQIRQYTLKTNESVECSLEEWKGEKKAADSELEMITSFANSQRQKLKISFSEIVQWSKGYRSQLYQGKEKLILINRSRIDSQIFTAKDHQLSFKKKFNYLCKELIEQCKHYVDLVDSAFTRTKDHNVRNLKKLEKKSCIFTNTEADKENNRSQENHHHHNVVNSATNKHKQGTIKDSFDFSEKQSIFIENVDMHKSQMIEDVNDSSA